MKRSLAGILATLALVLGTGGAAMAASAEPEAVGSTGEVEVAKVIEGDGAIVEAPAVEDAEPAAEEEEEITEEVGGGEAGQEVVVGGTPVVEGVSPDEQVLDEVEVDKVPPVAPVVGGLVAEISGVIGDITRDGCVVSIPVDTTGAGEFRIEVWDDGQLVDTVSWTMTDSGHHVALWTITEPALTGAPGVGFYLMHEETSLSEVDPFEYPADTADKCSAAVPVTVTLPGYDATAGVMQGGALPVAGSGFIAGESIEALLGQDGPVVGTFTADSSGAFSGTATIPAGAAVGPSAIFAKGLTSGRVGSADMKVVAPVSDEVTAEILMPTRDGCKVTIPVKTTGASSFELMVWDDGEIIDSFVWTMTEDGTHSVVWTITRPAGTSAPGVGFYVYVYEGGSGEQKLAGLDPFEYPAEVADGCSASVPVTLELPDVTPKGVTAGTEVKVTGSGYLPGEDVALTFGPDSVEVGVLVADEDGSISGTFKVPSDAKPGSYSVTSRGSESGRSAVATLKVFTDVVPVPTKPAAVKTPVAELAKTGVNSSDAMLLLGLSLLAVGASGVAISKRKRS